MSVLKFFKKTNKIAQIESKEVEGAEVWMVHWTSIYGHYGCCYERRSAKAFLSEDDANDFKKSLEEAQNILQNTNNIDIKIIKQE